VFCLSLFAFKHRLYIRKTCVGENASLVTTHLSGYHVISSFLSSQCVSTEKGPGIGWCVTVCMGIQDLKSNVKRGKNKRKSEKGEGRRGGSNQFIKFHCTPSHVILIGTPPPLPPLKIDFLFIFNYDNKYIYFFLFFLFFPQKKKKKKKNLKI
jgi:hypothetical protein